MDNKEFVAKLKKDYTKKGFLFLLKNTLILLYIYNDTISNILPIKNYIENYRDLQTNNIIMCDVNFYDGTEELLDVEDLDMNILENVFILIRNEQYFYFSDEELNTEEVFKNGMLSEILRNLNLKKE